MKRVRIGSISAPYFPAFGLNIQFECEKIRTGDTTNTDIFHAMSALRAQRNIFDETFFAKIVTR